MNYFGTHLTMWPRSSSGSTEGTRRATRTPGRATRHAGGEAGIAPCRQAASQRRPERTGPACCWPPNAADKDPRPSGPSRRKELKETALEIPGSGSTLGWNPPGLPGCPGALSACSGANAALCSRGAFTAPGPQDPPPAARSPWPRPVSPGWRCCWAHVASKLPGC